MSGRTRAWVLTMVCGLTITGCGGSDEAPRPSCRDSELLVHRGGGLACEDPTQPTPGDCAQGEALTAGPDGALSCAQLTPLAPECEEGSIVVQAANGLACEDPLELPTCGDGEALFVSDGVLECAALVPSCQDGEALTAAASGLLTCRSGDGALECADGEVVFESPDGLRCAQIVLAGGFVDVERRTLLELAASRDYMHRRGVSYNTSAPGEALWIVYHATSGDGLASQLADRPDVPEDLLLEMLTRGDITDQDMFDAPGIAASHLLAHINGSEDVRWYSVLASDAVDAAVLERVLDEAPAGHRAHALAHPELSPRLILALIRDEATPDADLGDLASNPSLTLQMQRELLALDVDRVASGLASNHITDSSLLEEIWMNDERGVWDESLARNPNTPAVVLTDMLQVQFGYAAESAAQNPSLSALDRRTVSGHPLAKLRRALCRNPSLTEAEAEQMATHPETIDAYTRYAPVSVSAGLDLVARDSRQLDTSLAYNDRTPEEVLLAIAQGNHADWIYSDLIEHPNAGASTFAFFLASPSINVRRALALHERIDMPTILALSQDPNEDVRRLLLRNPIVPPDIIEAMDTPTFDTDYTLAKHPLTSPEKLRGYYGSGHRAHEALAANPSTPADVLDRLAMDARGTYSEAVAGNPSVSREMLQTLLYDADPGVRLVAAISPLLE